MSVAFQQLLKMLDEKNSSDDWQSCLDEFLYFLAREIKSSRLDPLAVIEYLKHRSALWNNFSSSVVLCPVKTGDASGTTAADGDFQKHQNLGLIVVNTYWGEERPTLPGGRISAPGEVSGELRRSHGYAPTAEETAAQELFEECGVLFNPQDLHFITAVDVRLFETNTRLFNNHNLTFFLSPVIAKDTAESAFSHAMRAAAKNSAAEGHHEIAAYYIVSSFAEFMEMIQRWEANQKREYPFDRIKEAVRLFFLYGLDPQRLGEGLQSFNRRQNSRAIELAEK